ncbi:MAG: hypothetical protein ACXQTW_02920 [Candidatus Methanospirareceae archaeon]
MRIKIFQIASVIILIMTVVLITSSSPASASLIERTFTPTGGNITYEGGFAKEPEDEPAASILTVYSGEKIVFLNATNVSLPVIVSGPYTKKGEKYSGEPFKSKRLDPVEEWDSEGKKGYFKVEETISGEGGWFEVIEHSFTMELVGERERVQEGRNFSIRLRENEKEGGVMKLTIEDDEGYLIMNEKGTDIYEIPVDYTETEFTGFADASVDGIEITEDKELLFDTSKLGMDAGKYTIILEDYATEADDDLKIEVEEKYLDVECDEEVVMGGDIVIIIKSSFYKEQATVTVEDIPEEEGRHVVTLDEDGKKKVKIPTEDLGYGTYKITVEVSEMKETRYVKIKRGGSSLEVPDNATVGDIVHIKGTSDSGDLAVFLIDDTFKGEARISDGKFEWDWDTRGELAGYREIEVFMVDAHDFSVGDRVSDEWQRVEGVDASAGIFLLLPIFSMTAPEEIAEGDEAVISGRATGTDQVYIILIDHEGEVVFPSNGIARATPVEGGTWEERISDLETGRYVVISMVKGRDGETNAIEDGEWAAGGEGKTMEQRVAILKDAMTSAGSDDIFELAYFSVSTPQVSLNLPETAEVGDEIRVTAETNIKDGEKAFLSLSSNSNIVKTTSALVANGSIHTSIDTSGLQPGRYKVGVYIGGRASDEEEVILVEKTEEEGEESLPQNESLAEPEAAAEVNESMGGGNESQEEEQEIPVNVWDVLIALATVTLLGMKRRCR